MVWSLEIHHIDIGQGDSTLIVAEDDGVGMGHVAQVRAALVDGGTFVKGTDVHAYVTGLGLASVDVIVTTHYDVDHFGGLRRVLLENTTVYDNANIFDQGEPGSISVKRARNGGYIESITGREQSHQLYLNAIASRGARARVTARVASNQPSALAHLAGWQDPDWLLGRELLWHNVVQPGGAPTITCIAANQYVDGRGGPHASGLAVDPKNEKSLALLVQFGNFRYYLGGDLESTQEAQVAIRLNPANNAAGRVLAMKVSHHGSDRSTSQPFLNRLRPSAAFISCGINNIHYHPRPIVLNQLQLCGTLQHYYMTEDRSDAAYYTRVGDVGTGTAPNLGGAYTAKAVVAGAWGAPYDAAPGGPQEGHIVLSVDAVQSQRVVTGPLLVGDRFTVSCSSADSLAAGAVVNGHL